MRKTIMGLLVMLCIIGQIRADVITHTFRFNESGFAISQPSPTDSLVIASLTYASAMPAPTEPGIPILGKTLALTGNDVVKNYSVTFSKRLIRSGVDVANATMSLPMSLSCDCYDGQQNGYVPKMYPDSNCVLTNSSTINGVKLVNFSVVPFVFDAVNRNLYFIDSLQVNLEVESGSMRKAPTQIHSNQVELLQSIFS